jgi:hypothetical protein
VCFVREKEKVGKKSAVVLAYQSKLAERGVPILGAEFDPAKEEVYRGELKTCGTASKLLIGLTEAIGLL